MDMLFTKSSNDCDMIKICEKIHTGTVYKLCYKGGDSLNRCKIADRTMILALSKIIDKLENK